MLYTKSVNPTLLRVLNEIMTDESFADMRLVGGTALALQMGHRDSVDIDLFGDVQFDDSHFNYLKSLGNLSPVKRSKVINIFFVDGVKVDFVKYRYPWLDPIVEEQGIRMASQKDIAAMKFSAIGNRGSKKDYVDLYYLLKKFSFEEIFQFYVDKFDDGNPFLIKKSLLYFKDADKEPDPIIFDDINWEEIKESIVDIFIKEGY